jgi:large subunit ribosomal protein L23
MNSLALVPRMSEKAFAESQKHNTYVFIVPMVANEALIASAVTSQFGVTVEDVRTAIIKGKEKKSYKKGSRPVAGKRADFKKAYVRIKAEDKINIFGEEEKTEEKKAEPKADKPKLQTAENTQKRGLKGVMGRAQRQTQNRGGDN